MAMTQVNQEFLFHHSKVPCSILRSSLIFTWLVFYTTTESCAGDLMEISIITPKSVPRNGVRTTLISLLDGHQLRVHHFIRTVLGKSHQSPQKQHKAPVLWHRIAVSELGHNNPTQSPLHPTLCPCTCPTLQ